MLSNSWYMERFDTPAALHSASTPMLTPSWYVSAAAASSNRSLGLRFTSVVIPRG